MAKSKPVAVEASGARVVRGDRQPKPVVPEYFRVYDSRGKLLLDILPKRLAARFCREWNKSKNRTSNPVRLVRCQVTEQRRTPASNGKGRS